MYYIQNITVNNMNEATPEQFLLKWHNHGWNFCNSFGHLLDDDILSDVTVGTSDGVRFKAHKVVLAACSNYFYDIFVNMKNAPHDAYPYICLSDIKSNEFHSILRYMYKGEVTVSKNDLDELIRIGQLLEVKGLSQPSISSDLSCDVPSPESSVSAVNRVNEQNNRPAAVENNSYLANAAIANQVDRLQYEQFLLQHYQQNQNYPGIQALQNQLYSGALQLAAVPQGVSRTYSSTSDPSPLSKKKLSSQQHSNNILRRALDDSSLVANPQGPSPISGTASLQEYDRRNSLEMPDDERRNSPRAGNNTPPVSGRTSATGNGNNQTSREWKRYKQYTRENVMDAMNAVREKRMSALMAAKHYCVPSRTLYDKLKKAGIIPARNNSGRVSSTATVHFEDSARFPYPSNNPNSNIYAPRSSGSIANEDIINNANNDNSNAYSAGGSGNGDGGGEMEQVDEAMDMSANASPNPNVELVEDLSIRPKEESQNAGVDVSVIIPPPQNVPVEQEEEDPSNEDAQKDE